MRIRLPSALILMGLLARLAVADPIYVDDDASLGGDGTSWSAAFRYLQDALAAAAAGDEIRVAQGVYKPDQSESGVVTPGDRQASFELASGVALYGGYRGCPAGDCAGGDPDERDLALYETILSGDLLGDDPPGTGSNAENSYQVVTASAADETATFDGFTVTRGNANGDDIYGGAGMYIGQGSPLVAHCRFTENSARRAGGGLYTGPGSHAVITSCTTSANRVPGGLGEGGGGIFADGEPTITGCVITGNWTEGYGLYGGGIYCPGGATISDCVITGNGAWIGGGFACSVWDASAWTTITDCTIEWNMAEILGGGIACQGEGILSLTHCSISGNWAYDFDWWNGGGLYGDGGGMYVFGVAPVVTLSDCVFSGNVAGGGGGISCDAYDTTVTISGSTFSGNVAKGGGGAISTGWYYWGGGVVCTNCTFSGNSSPPSSEGGAIAWHDGTATIGNCTFAGNTAGSGGAISWGEVGGTIFNCVFSGNSATDWAEYRGGGAVYGYSPDYWAVMNCTFARNTAAHYGGGIWLSADYSVVTNCILRGDTPDEIYDYSGNSVVTFSDLQGGWPGAGNIEGDPLFAAGPSGVWTTAGAYDWLTYQITFTDDTASWTENELAGKVINPDLSQPLHMAIAANTATTITAWADARTVITGVSWVGVGASYEVYEYRLTAGSPCVNAGSNYAPVLPATDMDGAPRVQQCRVDMGAYESPYPPAAFSDCNNNGVDDDCDIYEGTSADCNQNQVPDECDLAAGTSLDCNGNGTPDECDIAQGASEDCNENGVPDECEPQEDCNGNGLLDICDLFHGTSRDCNWNGILDECDLVAGTSQDCNGNGIPDECDISAMSILYTFDSDPGWSTQGQWAFGPPSGAGSFNHDPTAGHTGSNVYGYNLDGDYANNMSPCYLVTPDIGFSYAFRVELRFWRWLGVESYDQANVQVSNDGQQWRTIWKHTGGTIADTTWTQCLFDISGLIDYPGTVYVRWGMGPTNASVTYPGWNIDDVEIRFVTHPEASSDCNANGIPDECDIAAGTSQDCTGNGVPDECEPDCNGNGIADSCDIADGTSPDANGNGIPDECDPPCTGDLNCDGMIDFADINPFVLYLSNCDVWQQIYPDCFPENGDINCDGTYGQGSFGDISGFVALMTMCGYGCPCPGPGCLR